ncbi:hypothetical protein BRM3_00295 [Brachybacterium huguangmaarense]|uniref:DUF4878 domain-containing protein n=1 Tax=Brachybacterium huguangmaarense TaxID=1652028 RepID=A0ABY6G283_9MICO|nr:hypothetical protein [Brachybacterium huguangmaarense]UYG16916.1 hypothetical protein BRM3_00295 [Brachybacterium huguangmaarense]
MTAYPPPSVPGPQPPRPAMPVARPWYRRAWVWITAGACLVLLLLAAAAAAVGLFIALSSTPEKTVRHYQTAWDTSDCELYVDATRERFRDGVTCADFEEAASEIPTEHEYELISSETEGDRATVVSRTTVETSTSTFTETTEFHLVKRDRDWLIDSAGIVDSTVG